MIMRDTPPDIMNVLARSILLLYAYDEHAEDRSAQHEIHTAISLISPSPAHHGADVLRQAAPRYNDESMIMHRFMPGQSTAETILSMLRPDRQFTAEEARMLDIMLCLHAEHGGGNNSSFTTHVLTSADTDPYSTYAAAIGSLKGQRHGGANHQVLAMQEEIKENVEQLGRRRRGGRLPGEDREQAGLRQDGSRLRHGACGVHFEVRPARRHLQAFRRDSWPLGTEYRGRVQPAEEHRASGA